MMKGYVLSSIGLIPTRKGIRASGEFEAGSQIGARQRKIVEFPNRYVFDFCDTVMGTLYGPNWLSNDRALKHELIRHCWMV